MKTHRETALEKAVELLLANPGHEANAAYARKVLAAAEDSDPVVTISRNKDAEGNARDWFSWSGPPGFKAVMVYRNPSAHHPGDLLPSDVVLLQEHTYRPCIHRDDLPQVSREEAEQIHAHGQAYLVKRREERANPEALSRWYHNVELAQPVDPVRAPVQPAPQQAQGLEWILNAFPAAPVAAHPQQAQNLAREAARQAGGGVEAQRRRDQQAQEQARRVQQWHRLYRGPAGE